MSTQPRSTGSGQRRGGFESKVSSNKVVEFGKKKTDISEEGGGTGIALQTQLLIFLLVTFPFLSLLALALYHLLTGDKSRGEYWPAMGIGIIFLMLVLGLTFRILLSVLTFKEDASSSDLPISQILVLYLLTPIAAIIFTISNTSSFTCEQVIIGEEVND